MWLLRESFKGFALFAPLGNRDVMEVEGAVLSPQTPGGKWETFFHFLSYFWLLTQCLT